MYNIKDGEDKNMNQDTAFKYRLNCIIKKLRSKVMGSAIKVSI